jgi:1-acyl-sn-glycerol-3-phosphate acyltransferase
MTRDKMMAMMNGIIRTITHPTYLGLENIPLQGGLIVATNHMSRMDTLLLLITPNRKDITALVADKYKRYPLFDWIIRTGGGIYLDRENTDFGALRAGVEALKRGLALGIAPEGTRSKNGGLLEGKPGTVLVALKAEVPIVPVGIYGTQNVFLRAFTLQRPRLTISFGKAFCLEPLDRGRRSEQMKEYTDEVMCRIAAQLPEKHHGFYKGYPRIKEIQRESQSVISQ